MTVGMLDSLLTNILFKKVFLITLKISIRDCTCEPKGSVIIPPIKDLSFFQKSR